MNDRFRFFILSPFIAVLLLAAYFFYFQWSYTKFKSINFQNQVLYGNNDIFSPNEDEYLVVIYNSKNSNIFELAKHIENNENLKILAIDFYQDISKIEKDNIIPLSAGANTLLEIFSIFQIRELPVSFKIKRKSIASFSQVEKKNIIKIN